ncbi:MAG: PTS sugar transporter subunit IIA [Staphylococcus equorum]|uniref:PTS sugar transporter subunit IIA n=1 Tax=Alkalibacterium TaxID=99906 RepID=UPI00264938A1|nr:fructose PTS transporter subunit IIA [Alkalibacterium sp.]MDN6293861.1 fructose PTS transporter subunit IIA [Alkalibacterium sp.]MDN6295993.1 fructose PTS transporter subunit IIA [Alkalibacterium sp.]
MKIDQKVLLNIDSKSQQDVFALIAEEAVKQGYGDNKENILVGLKNRELEGTTGMMDGFAIPHAKSKSILKSSLIILKLNKGIEWDSMDGKKIEFVISLLIPEEEKGTSHLKLLSKVARLLMREDAKNDLKQATTETDIENVLNKYIMD